MLIKWKFITFLFSTLTIVNDVLSTPTILNSPIWYTNRRKLDGRIVGGKYTDIKSFPFQVSIEIQKKHTCGGAILSRDLIVTAAHCILNVYMEDYWVRVGSTTRNRGGSLLPVQSIVIHDLNDVQITDYDIALLKLKSPLKFTQFVQPIKLATEADRIHADNMGTVTGWGNSDLNALILQKVEVPILNQDLCRAAFFGYETVTERMYCAGFLGEGGKDACQGDSGGPMVVDFKLYGITSWGYDCGSIRFPGVYVRLTHPKIRKWLLDHIHDNSTTVDSHCCGFQLSG